MTDQQLRKARARAKPILLFAFGSGHCHQPASPESGPALGQLAPDFDLIDVRTDESVRLWSCRNRPVVLFFGSLSCRYFCHFVAAMQKMYTA